MLTAFKLMKEHFTSVVLVQNESKKKQEEGRLEMIRLKEQHKREKAKRKAAEAEAVTRRIAEEEAKRKAAEAEAARQAERAEAAEKAAGEARVRVARQAVEAAHAQREHENQLEIERREANQQLMNEKVLWDREKSKLNAKIGRAHV